VLLALSNVLYELRRRELDLLDGRMDIVKAFTIALGAEAVGGVGGRFLLAKEVRRSRDCVMSERGTRKEVGISGRRGLAC